MMSVILRKSSKLLLISLGLTADLGQDVTNN